jgi:hypothetical protein
MIRATTDGATFWKTCLASYGYAENTNPSPTIPKTNPNSKFDFACVSWPNTRGEPRPMAGATQERTVG